MQSYKRFGEMQEDKTGRSEQEMEENVYEKEPPGLSLFVLGSCLMQVVVYE